MRVILLCGAFAALASATDVAHWGPSLSQYAPIGATSVCSLGMNRLEFDVRRQLQMLPFFGPFDHLAFRVDHGIVTLSGQVISPSLRYDAADTLLKEPVYEVRNEIHVLTVTPAENETRKAVFVALYSDPALSNYAMVPGGAIHIVVEGHRVTLEGEVASKADALRAAQTARAVRGVSAVVNHLGVCN